MFCWKHNTSLFSKPQLSNNTVSKTHFFNHPKKHLCQRKCHFWFCCNFRWNHCFIVFPGLGCLGPWKCHFSPFPTQIVSGNFWQSVYFHFSHFWWPPQKTQCLCMILPFSIYIFSFFCLSVCNIKKRRSKTFNFFSKTSFWHPDNSAKTLFWHQLTLFVFLNIPPKTL